MTNPPQSQQQDPKKPRNDPVSSTNGNAYDLYHDPDYQQLLRFYQEAEFSKCEQMLDELLKKYPGHPALFNFREELALKLSVKDLYSSIKKEEKISKRMSTLNLSLVAVIGTIVVLVTLFLSLVYFTDSLSAPDTADVEPTEHPMRVQLDRLYNQADVLLRLGRPDQAEPIVETIAEINPEHPNLTELQERLQKLLRLEAQYQAAKDLVAEGKLNEALEIFRNIEAEHPGLWDVSQQIDSILNSGLIESYLNEGNAAYQSENWEMAIIAYEKALQLADNNPDRFLINERLLTSYLNRIRQHLANNILTNEDIEIIEDDYQKAAIIISQDPAFDWAREDLNEVSNTLQAVRLTQGARAILADRAQTPAAVAQAVSDLESVAEDQPENPSLQQDLQNGQNYLVGLNHFINLNWADAITSLRAIPEVNPGFANWNAAALLFEAYFASGLDMVESAQYIQGLEFLEDAEALAMAMPDNLAKRYQVQTLIGETLGNIGEFQQAVGYYQNTLNAIDAESIVQDFPELADGLNAANNSAAVGQYQNALVAFQNIVESLQDILYSQQETSINNNAIIALFAHSNASTLSLVLQANNLPREMVIREARTLLVPQINR